MHLIDEITVFPTARLQVLSKQEVDNLFLLTQEKRHMEPFRRCAFATLVSVRGEVEYLRQCDDLYEDFRVRIIPSSRGIALEMRNVPSTGFVRHNCGDGKARYELIGGVHDNLFAVCRDLLFSSSEINMGDRFDLATPHGKTNAVFNILRHANVFQRNNSSPLIVCWGGHRIQHDEYDYTIEVGYQLGLRNLDICTGSGPGAMCGPMEGAAIAHAKQRTADARYIGLTEPEIIAVEPPNPIVNNLILLPDIEKRLEAFVRLGHAYIVFPGGVGTLEEICYLYGILLDPANRWMGQLNFILTGNGECAEYLRMVFDFIGNTLGEDAQRRCIVIHNAPEDVAIASEGIARAEMGERTQKDDFHIEDADHFRWRINIDPLIHNRFDPTHENVRKIDLYEEKPYLLAGHLRNFFSAVVAGGIKASGIEEVKQHGKFQVKAPSRIANALTTLIEAFTNQKRIAPSACGEPCFEFID